MFQLSRILVPWPSVSDAALAQALHLATRCQAALHLVRVDTSDGDAAPWNVAQRLETARAEARRLGFAPADAGRPLQVARVVAPSRAEGLLAYAKTAAAGLIVAAPASSALTDPDTAALVRQAQCPVLTVANDRQQPPARILAPIDFSLHAQTALAHAKTLAHYYGATLHALHVVEVPHYVALNATDMLALSDAKLPERKARRRLEAFVQDTGGPSVPVRSHVMHGDAAEHISTFAEHHHADLVTLASHGVLARRAQPLGNVARKTLRRLSTATLLLRAFGTSLMPEGPPHSANRPPPSGPSAPEA